MRSRLARTLGACAVVSVMLLAACWAANSWFASRLLAEERAEVAGRLSSYEEALATALNRRIALVAGLQAFVQTELDEAEQTWPWEFDTFARGLTKGLVGVRNVGMAQGGVFHYVYPLKGNEQYHGHDLMRDDRPEVQADARLAVETGRVILSGPYELRDGGLGLVARQAVFWEGAFWGFVAVVLDIPPLLAEARLGTPPLGLTLGVRDDQGRTFGGTPSVFEGDPVIIRVDLPDGHWEVAGTPEGGWENSVRRELRLFQGASLVTAALLTALTFLVVGRQERLRVAVEAQTREIRALNEELQRDLSIQRQMRDDLAREANINASVAELSRALIERDAIEDLSHQVLDRAKALTDSRLGFVGHLDPGTEQFVPAALSEEVWADGRAADQDRMFHQLGGLWGWVLTERKPLLTNAPSEDPRSSGVPLGHLPIHNFLAVPALVGDTLVGQIAVANADRNYGEQDLAVLERLGVLYALAVQRRWTEQERRELQAQVQYAQKLESLGVLAGGIAHDFNNLLMGMLGNADLAARALPADSPGQPFLRSIEKAATQAAELANQMLAYSGRAQFVTERIDLNRLVRDVEQLLESVISKKAVLQYHLDEQLPTIEGDPGQIRQVVMNLITNASEALGGNSGTVTVSTGVVETLPGDISPAHPVEELPQGPCVYLEVTDTGAGFDEQTRQRIFDPFFTTKFTGRGLGLAAVLGIVRGHEGTIQVASEPNRGSSFKVFFPRVSDQPPVAEEPTDETNAPTDRPDVPITVLVVDDEESVRNVARMMLEEQGFTVLTTVDGREAVEAVRRENAGISLVLLDATMPQLSGEEAFEELQRIRPELPVILSSGYSEQEATDRLVGKGLAGFLQKPYRAAQLLRAVHQALRQT